MIIDRLYETTRERGPVCLGLDPTPNLLPENFTKTHATLAEAYHDFNRMIIDATVDIVACYKVQIAHYEALGVEGLKCYRDTLSYIRARGAIAIGDVKRGDVASTQACYARAHLEGDFEADFITLNPYFGFEALRAFLPYLEGGDKGLFVLIRTSNPGAAEFQDFPARECPLYLRVAEALARFGKNFIGECGYSAIGGVVGGTCPPALVQVRRRFPSLFLLVPGYGAQGAGGREVAPAFHQGNGAVIAAARSIIGAHRGKPSADRLFPEYARAKVETMREDIRRWLW